MRYFVRAYTWDGGTVCRRCGGPKPAGRCRLFLLPLYYLCKRCYLELAARLYEPRWDARSTGVETARERLRRGLDLLPF